MEKEQKKRYVRKPEHDRRISRGDDFAGDAWLDALTGEIVYGAVGYDKNLGAFRDDRDALSGIYMHRSVARLDKGIPNRERAASVYGKFAVTLWG